MQNLERIVESLVSHPSGTCKSETHKLVAMIFFVTKLRVMIEAWE